MEFLYEDCKSLLEQVNLQEKELRHKRRWLIGLPTSGNEAGLLKESKFQPERPIPEYLLREDDVSYETITSFVKNQVEECDSKKQNLIFLDDMQLIHSPTDITTLLYLLDNMTNLALFHFSKLLTGGSIKFDKTRWKMKQIIKEHLSKNNTRQINLSNDQLSLLKNPKNFRWNPASRFIPDSDSSHSAVNKILSILEDLPTQTLSAMYRKLKGINNYIPKLIPKRCYWKRDVLIKSLREKCLRFLSILNKGDSLQEPLAKSMEIAGLTLKLIQGHFYAPNFIKNSPKIIALQNEIASCIQLLDQDHRVKIKLLKEIQITLDLDTKLSKQTLPLVKKYLTEYLFECGDIDFIPLSLLKVLAIIRKNYESNHKTDEEVECILSVSASMKQVLWDVIPEHEFDLEFADVYMEDYEESDGDDVCEYNEEHTETNVSISGNFDEEVGSTGENFDSVGDSDSLAGIGSRESYSMDSLKGSNSRGNGMQYHLVSFGDVERKDTDLVMEETMDGVLEKDLCLERDLVNDDDGGIMGNRYLGVQGASDEVSMVAYRVIGCMLGDFARIEGCDLDSKDLCYLGVGSDYLKQKHNGAVRKEQTTHKEDDCSILITAVEQIIPSFAKSEADRLTELMDGF